MKSPDISQMPIVKRYGIRGAKLFAKIWFSIIYLMLIVASTVLWNSAPIFVKGWSEFFVGCFVEVLVVIAASFLTRMRLEFLAGIERLSTQEERVPED